MSKIYDALNRAEMERGETVETIAQRFASVRVTKSPLPFPDPMESESEIVDPPLDLSLISRVPWLPSLDRLPALLERGKALEQFRSLRSHLREFRDLGELKTVLVTSGLPQEGKSFVSANLAISLARHKASKVLLIDGDMRRSSLPKLLGCQAAPGLTDYLSGNSNLTDIMQRGKAADGEELPGGLNSLFFIPAGSDADNAADLSGSPRFARLLAACAPSFDWIIVDSSPVNLVSDGVNLGRQCDGTLIVARGGVTEFSTAQRAISELRAVKTLGFVLNAAADSHDTGSYYGYDANPKTI